MCLARASLTFLITIIKLPADEARRNRSRIYVGVMDFDGELAFEGVTVIIDESECVCIQSSPALQRVVSNTKTHSNTHT